MKRGPKVNILFWGRSSLTPIIFIIYKQITRFDNLMQCFFCTWQQRMKSLVCIIICWMATTNQPTNQAGRQGGWEAQTLSCQNEIYSLHRHLRTSSSLNCFTEPYPPGCILHHSFEEERRKISFAVEVRCNSRQYG